MKKECIYLIIIMVSVLTACSNKNVPVSGDITNTYQKEDKMSELLGRSNQVMSEASSKRDAQEIARAYGISLHDYSYGVAVYDVPKGKNVEELIQYGIDNGLPLIEQVGMSYLDN